MKTNTTWTLNPIDIAIDTAIDDILHHMTDIEHDGVVGWGVKSNVIDEDGNHWMHLVGHSNTDGTVCRDESLYEVRPSGLIKQYSPKDGTYWNTDWIIDPLDMAYTNKGTLLRYFDKGRKWGRYSPKKGGLTCRYLHSIFPKGTYGYNPPRSIKGIWDHTLDNPFFDPTNPEEYEDDE